MSNEHPFEAGQIVYRRASPTDEFPLGATTEIVDVNTRLIKVKAPLGSRLWSDPKAWAAIPEYAPAVSDGGSSDYYKLPPNPKELLDLIEYREMNFSVGNIFKACYRLGQKKGNDRKYDLRKIIYFAKRELEREE